MASKRTVDDEQGEAAKLLTIFLQCRSYLARIAGRIVPPPHVEDVVQETFLRSFEASAKMEIRHPRSFMAKVAANIALNHVMKADNRPENHVMTFESADSQVAEPIEDQVDSQARLTQFCRAARRLPLQCRRAFILKKVYGLSRKEIAIYLGISESTAQKHIAKGTLMCAEYMEAVSRRAVERRAAAIGGREMRKRQ